MTPQQFIAKWGQHGPSAKLNERQGAQAHFIDLCQLLGVPTPGSATGTTHGGSGEYIFEQDTLVLGEARGYADVFYRDRFAWENKAPGKNLDQALKQLLTYSLALSNPPLLVVCDRLTTRIHTQFNGHPSEVHTVLLHELDQPEKQALLRRVWLDPESFRPKKTSRDITEAAAKSFATLAEGLRKRKHDADEVAHFLTQCLFCFFAEDVGLLPGRMFEALVNKKTLTADKLTQGLGNLFGVMRSGGLYGNDEIPWFNGGLFEVINVPLLTIMEVTELRNAAGLNWSAIDVSIFGTLFERGLDPSKRSQLGAHYTDPATILRIIEPVLTRPLLQKWELLSHDLRALTAKITKKGDKNYKAASAKFAQWLEDLNAYRVLDPACGSGNFLFLGLKALKDIEHKSHLDAAALGLDRQADLVTGPHNVLGIELNEYAAELARVTVWIGELQWRLAHGYDFNVTPVLQTLNHIECRDALLAFGGAGSAGQAQQTPGAHTLRFLKSPPTSAAPAPQSPATEASWPRASVVIGNPPFLGGSKKRRELGDDYFEALNAVYANRVPGFGDLVCYWFTKALKAIETNGLGAAGLVTTNSIRGGANRKVLDAICERSHIFEAWSDEGWVNDGAAVRVSLVCFGHGSGAHLDGEEVSAIHADLTPASADGTGADLTTAKALPETAGTCFMGASKKAPFDIDGATARGWLRQPNPHGKSNAEVVRPLCNGIDLTRRWGDRWIVDFGTQMLEQDATLFEAPYAYVAGAVRPIAIKNSDKQVARNWWRHARPRVDMRTALAPLSRYIITAAVAKYRTFIWMHAAVLPDQATLATARSDDTTFGILHSRFHELWSLRMCTWLGVGNDPRYTPTTCFETFPFPAGLTPLDTAHQRTQTLPGGAIIPAGLDGENLASNRTLAPVPPISIATKNVAKTIANGTTFANASSIATAAKRLSDLRDNWLNPAEWTQRVAEVVPLGMAASPYPDRILPKHGFEKDLAERTLTKLYNQRPAWLTAAHQALDLAVAHAYGWTDYTPDMPDDEILKRLLALNLERAGDAAIAVL